MICVDELESRCRDAIGKPIQKHLRRLGLPPEQAYGGCMKTILHGIEMHATYASHTPTGFDVEPNVILPSYCVGILQHELGRRICGAGDVLFGSIQVDFDYDPWMGEVIDLRNQFMRTKSFVENPGLQLGEKVCQLRETARYTYSSYGYVVARYAVRSKWMYYPELYAVQWSHNLVVDDDGIFAEDVSSS